MGKRVIASYCSSFLKPEMLHIYRQVKALRGVNTFVMTKELQNAKRFPFSDIEIIPKQRMNLLRHGWLKFVKRRPPVVYRGEYRVLASLLARRRADLMHIYFGHTGVHLLPFIKEWDKPSRIIQPNCVSCLRLCRWFWPVRNRLRIASFKWVVRRKNCGSIAQAFPWMNFHS